MYIESEFMLLEANNEKLTRENKTLVAALKNLVDWHSYDPNCIDNCPECMAYADAKEILAKAGG